MEDPLEVWRAQPLVLHRPGGGSNWQQICNELLLAEGRKLTNHFQFGFISGVQTRTVHPKGLDGEPYAFGSEDPICHTGISGVCTHVHYTERNTIRHILYIGSGSCSRSRRSSRRKNEVEVVVVLVVLSLGSINMDVLSNSNLHKTTLNDLTLKGG